MRAVCAFLHEFKPDRRFDVLFSAHVIEHVPDAEAFLFQCKALLNPGGKIILLTPNARAWKFDWLKSGWPWSCPPVEHTLLLTPKAARLFLERNGFVVDAIQTLRPGRAHYPVILTGMLSRLYTRWFARKATPEPIQPTTDLPSKPQPAGGIKSALSAYGRMAWRPILWTEYALLNLMDVLIGGGKQDELLIVARQK